MIGMQSNDFLPIIAQAIAEMREQHGEFSSIDDIHWAEFGRKTGLSSAKFRRLKVNGFHEPGHGLAEARKPGILDGYSSVLDGLLRSEISNSFVCLKRLKALGFTCGQTTVKRYIAAHKYLLPAKRQQIAPKGTENSATLQIPVIFLYSADLISLLTTHTVMWSHHDSFCEG